MKQISLIPKDKTGHISENKGLFFKLETFTFMKKLLHLVLLLIFPALHRLIKTPPSPGL